jgi:hypothetical protein
VIDHEATSDSYRAHRELRELKIIKTKQSGDTERDKGSLKSFMGSAQWRRQ